MPTVATSGAAEEAPQGPTCLAHLHSNPQEPWSTKGVYNGEEDVEVSDLSVPFYSSFDLWILKDTNFTDC